MKIVSFDKKVRLTFKKRHDNAETEDIDEQPFNPGARFVFSNAAANGIEKLLGRAANISNFETFYQQQGIQKPANLRGKNLLLYVSQGFGDQLMATALSHYFTKERGAVCYQLADNIHAPLWAANEYIQGESLDHPIELDALVRFKGKSFFDWFYAIEDMYHWEDCGEQLNAYDVMYSLTGVDPETVAARYKLPVFRIVGDDIKAKLIWLEQVEKFHKINTAKGYIVVQMRCSNVSRNIPNHIYILILRRLNQICLPVLCVDDRPMQSEISDAIRTMPNVRNLCKSIPDIRTFGTIVCGASLVVSPDSSAMHFAASSLTPCLSIWGAFAPEHRIKYYPNSVAIYHRELCPHAPCTNYHDTLPYNKCPHAELQKHCECFNGVTNEDIEAALTKLGIC